MIKQMGFSESQKINFCISFYFFQKLDLGVFVCWTWKISALIALEWTLTLQNFFIYEWILKKFALNYEAKGF